MTSIIQDLTVTLSLYFVKSLKLRKGWCKLTQVFENFLKILYYSVYKEYTRKFLLCVKNINQKKKLVKII